MEPAPFREAWSGDGETDRSNSVSVTEDGLDVIESGRHLALRMFSDCKLNYSLEGFCIVVQTAYRKNYKYSFCLMVEASDHVYV